MPDLLQSENHSPQLTITFSDGIGEFWHKPELYFWHYVECLCTDMHQWQLEGIGRRWVFVISWSCISDFVGHICLSVLVLNTRPRQHLHNLEMYRHFLYNLKFVFFGGISHGVGTSKYGRQINKQGNHQSLNRSAENSPLKHFAPLPSEEENTLALCWEPELPSRSMDQFVAMPCHSLICSSSLGAYMGV